MVVSTLKRMFTIACLVMLLFSLKPVAADGAVPITVDSENATWAVYNATRQVTCIIASSDDSTLWVGTSGGLQALGTSSALYTALDGLPSNRIESLALDDAGELWVGTDRGLAHFLVDGSWDVFTTDNSALPDNHINCLQGDSQGGLWIGTDSGLANLSSDGAWQVFTMDNTDLPDNGITTLARDDQDGLWIGTKNGLGHRRNDASWDIINTSNSALPSNVIKALLPTSKNRLYIGTTQGLALLPDGGDPSAVEEVAIECYVDAISCLAVDGSGGIWIGKPGICNDRGQCSGGSLVHLTDTNTAITYDQSQIGFLWPDVIYTDGVQGFWVGSSSGSGLTYFSLLSEGELKRSTQALLGLASDWITALANSSSGGVLAGTAGLLYRLDDASQWALINGDDAAPDFDEIQGLLNDGNGGLWIWTWGTGLAHLLCTGEWNVYNQSNSPLPDDYIADVLADGSGGVWASTQYNGIAHLRSDGSWEVFDTLPIPDYPTISQMIKDGNNEIWVGTWNGLAHLKYDRSWEVLSTANSSLPGDYIAGLLCDEQGRLWVGTLNGLGCLKPDGSWVVYDMDNSGLSGNHVSEIIPDHQGGIWMKTIKSNSGDYSIVHLDAVTGAWKTFSVDIIPGYEVGKYYSPLLADGRGGLWIGTDYLGLVHIDGDGQVDVYSTQNSPLPYDYIRALIADGSGGLWVGTLYGLAHLTDGTSSSTPVVDRIAWGSRGEDTVYCLDILDSDRQMLHQAVVCGQGLHAYAPDALDLSGGTYYWKIWSPGGYGGAGFEGHLLVSTLYGLLYYPWSGNTVDNGFDINADGNTDILWRHDTTGGLYAWAMDGERIEQVVPVEQRDNQWQLAGVNDVDGMAELLWYNSQTTETGISFKSLIDASFSYTAVATVDDADWRIKRIADFDGDGNADILWRHATSGEVAQWKLDGATLRSNRPFARVDDLDWKIRSAADFDGDGRADILWRNTATGGVCVWLMNGSAIVSIVTYGEVDTGWAIKAANDFNGDEKVDVLWRHEGSGAIVVWVMDAETVDRVSFMATVEDPLWEIKKTGDFDGDGQADILWQHAETGDVVTWFIDQTTLSTMKFVAAMPERAWKLQ